MSAWTAVLADLAARGGTRTQVANRLDLPIPLVDAVLDQAERLGVVAVAGGKGCASGCPTGPDVPPACDRCALVSLAPMLRSWSNGPKAGTSASHTVNAGQA